MAKTKAEIQSDYSKRSNRAAQKKYDAAHKTELRVALFDTTDADILQHLDTVGNKSGYVKALIRADIGTT